MPPTVTTRHAAFLIEEYTLADWRFEAGLRHEWQDIEVDSTQRDRSHRGNSVSLGAVWNFAPQYSLGMTLSRTQRLPTAEELYAQGLHMATSTWERGNPGLKAATETATCRVSRRIASACVWMPSGTPGVPRPRSIASAARTTSPSSSLRRRATKWSMLASATAAAKTACPGRCT